MKNTTTTQTRCRRGGNAGTVETVENRTPVSHRSHRPLEIARGAISTFPPRRRRFPLSLNQSRPLTPCGAFTIERKDPRKERSAANPTDQRWFWFQAHPALESMSVFRLTSHWNQFPVSGSFLDWKMLAVSTCFVVEFQSSRGGAQGFRPLPIVRIVAAVGGFGEALPVRPTTLALLLLVPIEGLN